MGKVECVDYIRLLIVSAGMRYTKEFYCSAGSRVTQNVHVELLTIRSTYMYYINLPNQSAEYYYYHE